MKKKIKLPKDFETLLQTRSLDDLKALFDKYDIDARGGYYSRTAIAFSDCSDELTRWLVEQGADLNAADTYGDTPLHARSRHWNGRVEILLKLGADVSRGENQRGTPLHAASRSFKPEAACLLLAYGARVDALDQGGETPLEGALHICRNADIQDMAALADVLLAAGAKQTSKMKEYIARIGVEFEFHRSNFNKDLLEATNAGLNRLYVLFDVPPAPRRLMHDGKSPIVVPEGRWGDQHQALWELLVPSSGAAATVQGEVIRVTGRIHRELYHNGGVNWGARHREMAKAFLAHIASGVSLSPSLLNEARSLVANLKRDGEAFRLCELGVNWVALNPTPIGLPRPAYEQ